MCLNLWDSMISHDENEKRWHRYDIDRTRSSHVYKYGKYKKCLNMMILTCIKQYLSNIWSSVYEKVKQHWSWVEKKHVIEHGKQPSNS